MPFIDLDIETALEYIKAGKRDKLIQYCKQNGLDYSELIEFLTSKGYLAV